MDGQIAAADRTSKWITGETARRDGHRLRADADIVIVGAGTVLDDDPRLDVRLEGYEGPQPRPVIVGGSRAISSDMAIMARDPLVYSPTALNSPSEVVVAGAEGRVDLGAMLVDLGKRGYVSALVEGGATLATALMRGGHINRMVVYLAAKVGVGRGIPAFDGEFGTITEAVPLVIESVSTVGDDVRIEAGVIKE
jgi:diaminohydroxyphosphoribosylaminopyrimidine deaminase/5-amino-6-(5-phosphoribosylamino)uracil reductase